MADPTDYDKGQDLRLDNVEALVTGPAPDNSADEFSYPVVGQPMTDDMWGWVTKGIGDGVLDMGGGPFVLSARDNTTDTVTLKTSTLTKTANAIVNGFYYQMSKDKTISLPAVNATTTYHVCLTYDPVGLDQKSGPVTMQVYAGTPPLTQGKRHVILHKITRKPNQLLSDATMEKVRPRISPLIYVWAENQLPEPSTCLWGQVCLVGQTGDLHRVDGDDNSTPNQWTNISSPSWVELGDNSVYKWAGHGFKRGILRKGNERHLRGRIALASGNNFKASNTTDYQVMTLPSPSDYPTQQQRFKVGGSGIGTNDTNVTVDVLPDGTVRIGTNRDVPWISLDGIVYSIK